MTKKIRTIIIGASILALAGMINFIAVDIAAACGWGQSGGGDYVPQRRDSGGFLAKKATVSEGQAREIVTNYVKRLNPALEIGKVIILRYLYASTSVSLNRNSERIPRSLLRGMRANIKKD